jgi:predicted transcriptional regulator
MSRSCALLFFQTRLSRGRYVAQTTKAIKLLRELEKFGLIERKRRGQGKPSLVYVKNFSADWQKKMPRTVIITILVALKSLVKAL